MHRAVEAFFKAMSDDTFTFFENDRHLTAQGTVRCPCACAPAADGARARLCRAEESARCCAIASLPQACSSCYNKVKDKSTFWKPAMAMAKRRDGLLKQHLVNGEMVGIKSADFAVFHALESLLANKPVLLADLRAWASDNTIAAGHAIDELTTKFAGVSAHKLPGGTALVFAPFAEAAAAEAAVAARAATLDVCTSTLSETHLRPRWGTCSISGPAPWTLINKLCGALPSRGARPCSTLAPDS